MIKDLETPIQWINRYPEPETLNRWQYQCFFKGLLLATITGVLNTTRNPDSYYVIFHFPSDRKNQTFMSFDESKAFIMKEWEMFSEIILNSYNQKS